MADSGSCSNPPQEEHESEISDRFSRLPDALVQQCLARVPRYCYRSLSRVCKLWKNEIRSQSLYTTRRTLNTIDFSLCLSVRFDILGKSPFTKWCEFFTSCNYRRRRLFKMSWLLPCVQPIGARVVSIDAKIYTIGGWVNGFWPLTVRIFDLVSHQCEIIESQIRCNVRKAAVALVNDKIYVMGGCALKDPNWAAFFDSKTRKWTSLPSPNFDWLEDAGCLTWAVVVKGKIIYHVDSCSLESSVLMFDTSSNVWTKLFLPSRLGMSCSLYAMTVIDDVLYCLREDKIQGYDYEEDEWMNLKLIEGEFPVRLHVEQIVNMNGRLVVLWKIRFPEFWQFHCAVIEVRKKVKRNGRLALRGTFVWAGFVESSLPGTRIEVEHCVAVVL